MGDAGHQMGGIHLDAAQFPSLLPFATSKDYDDYVTRLRNFPKQFDDTIANMREGMRDHLMPPKFLLEKVAEQAEDIAAQEPEKSPFAAAAGEVSRRACRRPNGRASARRSRRDPHVGPSRLREVRRVRARTSTRRTAAPRSACGRCPTARSATPSRVRSSTTTEPHAGRDPPDRTERSGAHRRRDAGDREEARLQPISRSFNARRSIRIPTSIRSRASRSSRSIASYIDQMYAKLPQLFGRLPKAKLIVVPIEEFREKDAAGARLRSGRAGRLAPRPGERQHLRRARRARRSTWSRPRTTRACPAITCRSRSRRS